MDPAHTPTVLAQSAQSSSAWNMDRLYRAVRDLSAASRLQKGAKHHQLEVGSLLGLHEALVSEGIEGVGFAFASAREITFTGTGAAVTWVGALALDGRLWGEDGQTTQKDMEKRARKDLAKLTTCKIQVQFIEGPPERKLVAGIPQSYLLSLRKCVQEEISLSQAATMENDTCAAHRARTRRHL